MKKRLFSILTSSLLAVSLLAGCSSGAAGTSAGGTGGTSTTSASSGTRAAGTDQLDAVRQAGVLRVGTEATYPPMEFADETGKAVGFDIDMMQYIADKLGVKLELVMGDFAGLIQGLSVNRYDTIVATMNITEERKKNVLFSEPYIPAVGLSIIISTKTTDIKGFSDLAGKKLGIQLGSTTDSWAATQTNLGEVKKYPRVAEALLDLSAGRIDAVVTDNVVGAYYMKKEASSYIMLEELKEAGPIGIAIPLDSPKLKEEIDKILAEMKSSGKMAELSQKWFGMDIYK